MMRPVNRIKPALPASAMKTYAIDAPRDTHWRPATCAEVGCSHLEHGWKSIVDESTELGARQAWYIRTQSGRSFVETRDASGLTTFTFAPGQRCFTAHKVRTGRPELFVVRGGDWRGNPRGTTRVHASPEDWVDDFATHQDKLATRLAQG